MPSGVDKRDLKREAQIRETPLWAEQRVFVEESIALLRAARAPEDFYRWHKRLLVQFMAVQAIATDAAARKARLRAQLRGELARSGPTRKRSLGREIARFELARITAGAVLSLYRDLGDALVWIVTGYRRGTITALGHGTRVDRLAPASGLDAEVEEIEWLWRERGVFALHTDLTNSVRHGDVLSVEQWAPRALRLSEIKATPRPVGSQQSRQIRRLVAVTDVLNRRLESLGPELPAVPIECPIPIRTHFAALAELVAQAKRTTYAWRELEPGFSLTVIDERNPAGISGDELNDARTRHLSEMGWGTLNHDQPDELSESTAHRVLTDRRHSFPGQVPLSLMPLDSRTVADLICGPLVYWSALRATALEQRLFEVGIDANVATGEDAGMSFMSIARDNRDIEFPAPTRSQILLELFTIDTITRTAEWLLGPAHSLGRRAFGLDYANDGAIWSRHEEANLHLAAPRVTVHRKD